LFLLDLSHLLDTCPKIPLGSVLLNHLLYADDLALVADSAEHLQLLLNTLYNYTVVNKLSVNINKSKIMIFGKLRFTRHLSFKLFNMEIEIVKAYKYLGVLFASSNNWRAHDLEISCKANKAAFFVNSALRRIGAAFELSVQQRILYAKILPILLYGSEVTGFNNFDSRSKSLLSYVRSILNVRRSTRSSVVLAEAGVLPFAFHALERSLKFFVRLKLTSFALPSELHTHALAEQCTMAVHGLPCWGRDVLLLLDNLKLLYLWQPTIPLSRAMNAITSALTNHWTNLLCQDIANTRFYSLLRQPLINFEPAKHLLADLPSNHRIALTRLRTESHRLDVVLGAWRHINRENRVCSLCKNGVGDEFHFLFSCTALSDLRELYLSDVPHNVNSINDSQYFSSLCSFVARGFGRLNN
jgi:hypothetical protein